MTENLDLDVQNSRIIIPSGYYPRSNASGDFRDLGTVAKPLETQAPIPVVGTISDYWKQPAVIAVNNFKFKSLSNFSFIDPRRIW
jgi:hypothetical protein